MEIKIKIDGAELEIKGDREMMRETLALFSGFMEKKVHHGFVPKTIPIVNNGKEPLKTCTGNGQAELRAIYTSTLSWEDIAKEIKAGAGPTEGDEVEFKLTTGEKVTVVVTEATDEYVRFDSIDCVGGKKFPLSGPCNTKDALRDIYKKLPDDLQAVIDRIPRKYFGRTGKVGLYEARLFLPEVSEIFSEADYGGNVKVNLYKQLNYYKDRRHRQKGRKHGKDVCSWWLASMHPNAQECAYFVSYSGSIGFQAVTEKVGIPICFCIKRRSGEA